MRSFPFVLLLLAATALGLGLRIWNANTAIVHEDELHYASDGLWMKVLPATSWATFLREHPHPHLRLDLAHAGIAHWGDQGTRPLVGHPALLAMLLGPVLAMTHPQYLGDSVPPARLLCAIVDASVIPVMILAVLAFGFSPVVALLAGLLYAVSPTAATYGSLAYPDALLALWGSCILLAASVRHAFARALLLGVFSALMVASKGTGLLGPVFAMLLLLTRGPDLRALATFALSFVVVATVFVDPGAYLAEVLNPNDPATRVRVDLLTNLCDNLRSVMDFDHYYWLGFGQHGGPLAPLLARASRLLTPVYVALLPIGFFVLGRRRGLLVAGAAMLPILALLLGLPASNGMWRFQAGMPIVCFVVACAIGAGGARSALVSAAVALVVVVQPLLPLRPSADGAVSLPSVLFANPDAPQGASLFNVFKGRPFYAGVEPGRSMSRRLWLAPGHYRVTAQADGPVILSVDGKRVDVGAGGELDLSGYLHLLELGSDLPRKIYSVGIAGA